MSRNQTKIETLRPEALNGGDSPVPGDTLSAAMCAAYAEIDAVGRDRDVQAGSRKYKYATLDAIHHAIRPILANYGLAVLQMPHTHRDDSGRLMIGCTTRIVHGASGDSIGFDFMIPCPVETAQAVGSTITYAKRYSYPFAVTSSDEDDDGVAALPQPRSSAEQSHAAKPQGDAITAPRAKRLYAILGEVTARDRELAQECLTEAKKKFHFEKVETMSWKVYDDVIEFIEGWQSEPQGQAMPNPEDESQVGFDEEVGF